MRPYSDKTNVQKKSYYTDRYYVAPSVPKATIDSDEVFARDVEVVAMVATVQEAYIQLGHLVLFIDAVDNKKALTLLKDELGYEMLMEMSCIDWLAKRGEFEVFYELLNVTTARRIRLKMFVKENQALESVSDIFRSADWSEREAYDMFGIKINNHPYMKRLLMPDDWQGHPLRKTYPLQGDEFAAWYEVDKIFGKEARDLIGPEIRDAARIDRYDTTRFARLGHEVPFGTNISQGEPDTPIRYQEEGGVFLIKRLDATKTKTLDNRR
ncbi:MAG: NADH dehydrogenase [Sulfuricurvum sp. PC08-66]|nr:MAG: NADH dehydrogenase [Sulfuricurvum sp. PC08-66]